MRRSKHQNRIVNELCHSFKVYHLQKRGGMTLVKVVTALLVSVVALVLAKDVEQLNELRTSLTTELQLGIDLGTTQSVAAICARGNVSVVQVDGQRTTPSTVWFSKGRGIEVGQKAVQARSSDPGNVIYAAKRVIGVEYEDPEKESLIKDLPFDFAPVGDHGPWSGNVGFRLSNKRVVSPEQVGALVLKKLKRAAEASPMLDWVKQTLGFTFKSLTVSVPVTFDEEQKKATIRACRMAGFRQVRLIEEPVAAAIAYGLGKEIQTKRVLVFDIGGGTLDVALLHFNSFSGTFYVESTAGEPKLGGEDFDKTLADLVLGQISNTDVAQTVRQDPTLYHNLLVQAERAKKELSSVVETVVCVPTLSGNCIARIRISRELFQSAAKSLFEQSLRPVGIVLQEGGLDRNAPIDVVLVGGTSRVPAVREMLMDFMPNATLHYDGVDPDEAVAIGAAKSWGCNQ